MYQEISVWLSTELPDLATPDNIMYNFYDIKKEFNAFIRIDYDDNTVFCAKLQKESFLPKH